MQVLGSVWEAAVSPQEPVGAMTSTVVRDALVTPFERGRTHAASGPSRWMRGAVHTTGGDLVVASQRVWTGDPLAPVPVDPAVRPAPPGAHRVDGHWRYVGHWTQHFGHFLLEVVTNLWGEAEDVRGLVAHRSFRGTTGGASPTLAQAELSTWQRDLLRLAGYGNTSVGIVRSRAVRVDSLSVPSRPLALKAWAHPEAVQVWHAISDAVGRSGTEPHLFLSRSAFHRRGARSTRSTRSDGSWDAWLDRTFAAAGFAVVHPETLSIADQVALVRGARVIAGAAGSALHLSAFARPGTHVLEIGDDRTPDRPHPTQQLVDAACGHLTAFAPYRDHEALVRLLQHAP